MSRSIRHLIALSFAGISTFVVAAAQAQTPIPSNLEESHGSNEAAIAEVKAVNSLEEGMVFEANSDRAIAESPIAEKQEPSSQRVPMGCRIFPSASMQQ